MKKIFFPVLMTFMLMSAISMAPVSANGGNKPYYSVETIALDDGTLVDKSIINGPPKPPPGSEIERAAVALPKANPEMGNNTLTVPAFNWFFGCSATSGAMIAGYYDRTGFPSMYTGPTNSGVMPLDNSSWPTWSDGYDTYGQCPLTASHQGLDGRATRGSIDDYWVAYDSSVQDPYITNGWTQHTWGDAIGDYMKTSQSASSNPDGATTFYTWTSSPSQLTCSQMVSQGISTKDGTYGRKLFYEVRGYTVTDCYNQKTDNNAGGFTFAMFKAEIDAGRPVMLNLEGHTIVGVGYDNPSTVYLHDTWDYLTHTMTWGGSYGGMVLLSVSVVNIQPPANPVPTLSSLDPSSALAGSPSFSLTVHGTNFVSGVSTVRWSGSNRSTTFISSTQLQASILASDIATPGSASVTVFNTTPGGGTSNALSFSIDAPFHVYIPHVLILGQPPLGLVNGDFESGPDVGWTQYSSHGWQNIYHTDDLPVPPHGGDWAAWLGDDSTYRNETGSISQAVTIPASAPHLVFWYWINSNDYCDYDYAYVYIDSTIEETFDLCSTNNTGGWMQHSIDLSSYAGINVMIKFLVDTDTSRYSMFFLDDISFSATGVAAGETGTQSPGMEINSQIERLPQTNP